MSTLFKLNYLKIKQFMSSIIIVELTDVFHPSLDLGCLETKLLNRENVHSACFEVFGRSFGESMFIVLYI